MQGLSLFKGAGCVQEIRCRRLMKGEIRQGGNQVTNVRVYAEVIVRMSEYPLRHPLFLMQIYPVLS